jgi:transposase-like protein
LRFGLSYRDVEELLAERGIDVDHVTVHRWVQRFTPLLADAARFGRHRVGDCWHVDETSAKVCERWVCLYRAVDQFGQVIDVYASTRRDGEAARRFFQRARTTTGVTPTEVITDRAPTYPRVLDHLWPAVWHHVERYANNRVEADHAQLKRRLRPMRGIKTMTGLRVLAAGHAFVQNLRRGHYEIAANQRRNRRLPVAFCEWPRQSKVLHRTTGHPGLRHARLMQQTPGHHGSAAQAPSLMSIIDVRRPKS